jgi:4-hydroxyphenylpyruvate dioxygenase
LNSHAVHWSTGNELALCWATAMQADLSQLIDAAAFAGYPLITISPHLYFDALEAGHTTRSISYELRQRGVAVSVVDALVNPLPASMPLSDASDFVRRLFSFTEAECFAVAEALEARQVMMVHPYGGKVSRTKMADVIGGIAARAATRGLDITIEFSPTSLTIDTLESALGLATDIGAPNVGVLLDTWHFYRSGGELDDLAGLPPAVITAIQINDAPSAAQQQSARALAPLSDRLMPGEGDIPLRAILESVLAGQPELTVGVEVFSSRLRALSPREAASQTIESTLRVLREVDLTCPPGEEPTQR